MNGKLIIFLFFVGYSTATPTIEEDELLYNDSFWSVLKGIAGALFGDEARGAEATDVADRENFIEMLEQHPRRDMKRVKFLAMLDQKLGEDSDEEGDEAARGFDAAINNAEKVKLFEELIKLKQQQGKGKRSQSTKRGDDDY